ncbi:hypothetical protein AAII07_57200 [Microvirga sp. 0TCS3.31]
MKRIVAVSLLAVGLAACNHTIQANPNTVLERYGYLQQVPPVAEHGPGTLVWRRTIPQPPTRYASLGYICRPEFTADAGAPISSPTERSAIGRELNASFNLTGAEVASFGIGAAAQYVNKVTLSFENVEVQEYPLETLARIRSSLGPECKRILREQIRKDNAYQVVSVIKADVTYNVEFKSGASLSAKAEALTAIGAKLGFDAARSDGTAGKGLYYGVALESQT